MNKIIKSNPMQTWRVNIIFIDSIFLNLRHACIKRGQISVFLLFGGIKNLAFHDTKFLSH